MKFFGGILGDDAQCERVVATTVIRSYAEVDGRESASELQPWRSGVLDPVLPSTIRSAEVEQPRWFGSKVVEQ